MEKVVYVGWDRGSGHLVVQLDCGGAMQKIPAGTDVAAAAAALRTLADMLVDGANKRQEVK